VLVEANLITKKRAELAARSIMQANVEMDDTLLTPSS